MVYQHAAIKSNFFGSNYLNRKWIKIWVVLRLDFLYSSNFAWEYQDYSERFKSETSPV